MANIFDGIKAMSDEEIRMEIALFSQVNFSNAAKETGNKVIGSIAQMASSFIKSFGGKGEFSYEVVRVTDMVRKDMEALRLREREWLVDRLKSIICEKFGIPGEVSNDTVSVMVVREAAVTYGVEKYDTFANKLEKVSVEYNKALLSTIHNMLVNQEPQEARDTDRRIQKALDRVSIDEKRNLQRLVMPKEFSGTGIARVLRLERDVKNLTYVVNSLGLECFDEVMVHTSAVVGAVKVLRSMSRVLCAQLVWLCVQRYKGEFGVDEKLMPSFMNEAEKADNDIWEKEFRGLLAGRRQMEERILKAEGAYAKNEEQLNLSKEKLDNMQDELSNLESRFDKLKADKDKYVNGHMPDGETKRYYNDVNETNRQVERAKVLMEKQLGKVDELSQKSLNQSRELMDLKNELGKADEVVKARLDALTSEIRGKWTAFFFRMRFEPEVFGQIATEFWSYERLAVEIFLKEIHDSEHFKKYKNYDAFKIAEGKLRAKVGKNVTAYIVYRDDMIVAISSKDILVGDKDAEGDESKEEADGQADA
ncbi:MAG: hypothetical protein IJB96_07765 [Lachnospira sp.]|nr:hypothetical protein [Lachnospira sp.]